MGAPGPDAAKLAHLRRISRAGNAAWTAKTARGPRPRIATGTNLSEQKAQAERRHAAVMENLEERAFRAFCKLRWPYSNGKPICPRCGSLAVYHSATRRRFTCAFAGCNRHQFTPTSGTPLHSRKLSYLDLMVAIETAQNIPNSHQFGIALGITARSAYLLWKKLIEWQENREQTSAYRGY